MRFDEWFDPYDPDHMQAYEHLCNSVSWPEGSVPDKDKMPMDWIIEIQAKMAKAWLHVMKHGMVIGSSPFDA